jgi:hypothetical protein
MEHTAKQACVLSSRGASLPRLVQFFKSWKTITGTISAEVFVTGYALNHVFPVVGCMAAMAIVCFDRAGGF